MEKYSIYCTEAQTKKALELGAPLHIIESTEDSQIKAIKTIASGKNKDRYTLVDNFQQAGDYWCKLITIPTAEQMIGWLEENTEIERVNIVRGIDSNYYWDIFTWKKIASSYSGYIDGDFSRKEATLAAIDAALEYLSNNKK